MERNDALIKNNTRIYSLNSGPHITRFSPVVVKKRKIFWVNLCFETSEHSVETAGDNSKVTWQAPQVTLVLYIFKLVFYCILKYYQ